MSQVDPLAERIAEALEGDVLAGLLATFIHDRWCHGYHGKGWVGLCQQDGKNAAEAVRQLLREQPEALGLRHIGTLYGVDDFDLFDIQVPIGGSAPMYALPEQKEEKSD